MTVTRRRPRVALAVVAALVALATASLLAPDPDTLALAGRLTPPSAGHWLGTDHLGRDVLARLLVGTRLTLGLTTVAVTVSAAVGTLLGLATARFGGLVEQLTLQLIDLLVVLPSVLVALVLAALLEPGPVALLLAVTAAGWLQYARLVHDLARKAGTADFVLAAEALGASARHIARRHVLPTIGGPLAALACLDFATTLVAVAGLSFLGLGAQPPAADWGVMLAQALPYLERTPLLALAPATAIVTVGLAVTLAGQAIQGRIDPRATERTRVP